MRHVQAGHPSPNGRAAPDAKETIRDLLQEVTGNQELLAMAKAVIEAHDVSLEQSVSLFMSPS